MARHVFCALTLGVAACGRLDFATVIDVEVEPAYASAPDWNDWIRNSMPELPAWAQPELACDDTATGIAACVHAGELRRVSTPLQSCAGVATTDALGVFQWTCVADGSGVTLFATGLRPGVGLRDLVDADGWRTDAIEVRQGGDVVASSLPAVWWNNPVVPAPVGPDSITLATPGTIYVVADTVVSDGYVIDADQVALVVLRGATLVADPAQNTNCDEASGPGHVVVCDVASGSHSFLWLEGDLDANDAADYNVLLVDVRFARLRGVRAASAQVAGIVFEKVSSSMLVDAVAVNAAGYGFNLSSGHDNVISGLTAATNGHNGNPGDAGVYLETTSGNVLTRVLAANNVPYGVLGYTGTSGNTFANVMVASNAYDGVELNDPGNVVAQVVAVNHPNNAGVDFLTANAGALVIAANNGIGVETDTTPPGLTSALLVGSNGQEDCEIWQGTSYVLSCAPLLASTSVMSGIDLAGSLRAAVVTDDSANASDVAGAAQHDAITDWFHFESPSRTWGQAGAWPGAVGLCAGGCQIWDWRRTVGDSVLVAHDATGAPSDEALVPGAPCPTRLDGNHAAMDASGRYFLLEAVELIGDGIGNDDGLCQSGETCLDLRTAGAARDELLTWTSTGCTFRDGLVTGVDARGVP